MKLLVIGGTSGLGYSIVNHFDADQISSTTGYPIPEKINEAVELSLSYDVIVNCLPDSNQNKLLLSMYAAHHAKSLATYFITIGSMSWRFNDPGHSKRDLFDWNEQNLLVPSTVRHTLLNPAWLWNSKDQSPIERITEQEILETIDFLINRSSTSVISLLEIKGSFKC